MAMSAARSMGKFAAGGFQRVPQEIRDARLAQCHGCEYENGPKCVLCGCFIEAKAWMPHEDCPIAKWPA